MVPDLPSPEALARARAAAEVWVPAFLDGVRAPASVYAPDAGTWHAATGTWSPLGDQPPSWARLRAAVPDLRREDVTVDLLADGILLRASTVGTVDGVEARVAVCLVVRLDEAGRIRRFEEYADRTSAEPFVRALRS